MAFEDPFTDKQFEHIVSLCLSWLRYQTPNSLKRKRERIVVGAQKFEALISGKSASPGLGPYLPVLREAQFYWAAMTLESPMQREAAFLRRDHREAHKIAGMLFNLHRKEWLAWEMLNPVQSVNTLIQCIAEEMAYKLGPSVL